MILFFVLTAVPAVLRNWLPSLIATGIGAVAACGLGYFFGASSEDKRLKFTSADWALSLLIVAVSLISEYLRTLG